MKSQQPNGYVPDLLVDYCMIRSVVAQLFKRNVALEEVSRMIYAPNHMQLWCRISYAYTPYRMTPDAMPN